MGINTVVLAGRVAGLPEDCFSKNENEVETMELPLSVPVSDGCTDVPILFRGRDAVNAAENLEPGMHCAVRGMFEWDRSSKLPVADRIGSKHLVFPEEPVWANRFTVSGTVRGKLPDDGRIVIAVVHRDGDYSTTGVLPVDHEEAEEGFCIASGEVELSDYDGDDALSGVNTSFQSGIHPSLDDERRFNILEKMDGV